MTGEAISQEPARWCAALLHLYFGHWLSDNQHGLVVNAQMTQASGTAKHDAAAQMLADTAQVSSYYDYLTLNHIDERWVIVTKEFTHLEN